MRRISGPLSLGVSRTKARGDGVDAKGLRIKRAWCVYCVILYTRTGSEGRTCGGSRSGGGGGCPGHVNCARKRRYPGPSPHASLIHDAVSCVSSRCVCVYICARLRTFVRVCAQTEHTKRAANSANKQFRSRLIE